MTTEIKLKREDAISAAEIQAAIDSLAPGGRVILPEMDLVLDRGIELRTGVELIGQGEKTVLRKGPGRIYPLSGYHNYGMCDVPLESAEGLAVGMTVSVLDDVRRGFYETFARITWIDGNWVGLDHGIEADYRAEDGPRLTTAYPLIFGHNIAGAAVRDLSLEGVREDQDTGMGGCRGGAIYFAKSREIEITGIRERDYHGEGLSFQMCRDVIIRDCAFNENTGNGLHPGAGSTNCLFEDCTGEGNEMSGFFFCVRANHITVRQSQFQRNRNGVSIGTRDCHNIVDSCRIAANRGEGILVREGSKPVEVHSCRITGCRIEGNAIEEGEGQIAVRGAAHDIIFEGNEIAGSSKRQLPGIFVAPSAREVYCADNEIRDSQPSISAADECLAGQAPEIECGYGDFGEKIFRHLPLGRQDTKS